MRYRDGFIQMIEYIIRIFIFKMKLLAILFVLLIVQACSLPFVVTSVKNDEVTIVKKKWIRTMLKKSTKVKQLNEIPYSIVSDEPYVVKNIEWNYNPYKYPCVDETALKMKLNASSDILFEQIPLQQTCVPGGNIKDVMRAYWKNGKNRTVTKIHYDMSDNIVWCDVGVKIWFLWRPNAKKSLKLPLRKGSGYLTEASYFLHEVDSIDEEMFSVVLRGKDVLYIPPEWPHTVYTFKNTYCISNWNLRRGNRRQ